ncbi:MAG: hypothetical protein LAN63_10605 [Acidobacteriia bacterium]|nr:hypothetical protein [Terriglobia bacterium]
MASLEIWSSLLTFAGGSLLTLDALFAGKRISTENGAKRLQSTFKKKKSGFTLKDESGNPLGTETALSLWLAKEALHWSWAGYLLLTVGFVLDFLSKIGKG